MVARAGAAPSHSSAGGNHRAPANRVPGTRARANRAPERRAGQRGSIGATELLLIGTILAIGLVVGLQALRVAVITELADLAEAIARPSQSYSYSGAAGHHGSSTGSAFQDQLDTCDTSDLTMTNPRCLQIPPGTPIPPGPPSP